MLQPSWRSCPASSRKTLSQGLEICWLQRATMELKASAEQSTTLISLDSLGECFGF